MAQIVLERVAAAALEWLQTRTSAHRRSVFEIADVLIDATGRLVCGARDTSLTREYGAYASGAQCEKPTVFTKCLEAFECGDTRYA